MVTVAELASVVGLTKERIKQIISQMMEESPNLDIEPGSVWKIGPKACRTIIEQRGYHYPQRKIVTFAALKGGIGKTTISTNVAVRAASLGAKVLLIDIDPEACATSALVKENFQVGKGPIIYDVLKGDCPLEKAIIQTKYPNLDIVPSALANHKSEKEAIAANPKRLIRDKLESLKQYNIIFLELPPSFTTLTSAAYLAADLIVIPCTPNVFSLESVALTIEAIDRASDEFEAGERNYKILMNQYNSNRVASQQVLDALMETYRSKVMPIHIKESAEVQNATNAGLTVFEGKANRAIRETFSDLTLSVCELRNE